MYIVYIMYSYERKKKTFIFILHLAIEINLQNYTMGSITLFYRFILFHLRENVNLLFVDTYAK